MAVALFLLFLNKVEQIPELLYTIVLIFNTPYKLIISANLFILVAEKSLENGTK